MYKSFSVGNSVEGITKSSEGITEFCEQNGLGTRLTMAISLVIEEILVVIRARSLAGDNRATMNVRVLIEEDTVILRVRNGGKVFSPVDYVKNAGKEEEAEVIGIKMILALALNIDYRNIFGVNNTTIAAKYGREYLREQTFLDVAKLVRAEGDTIDLRLKGSADTVALLKGYIERIYGNKKEFRPLRIPNYRDVLPCL